MTDKGTPILFYSFLFCVQVLIIRGDLEMKVSSCPVARWSATGLKDGTEANYNPGGGGGAAAGDARRSGSTARLSGREMRGQSAETSGIIRGPNKLG